MVQETRLISTWFNSVAWDDDAVREPGVAICRYVVRLGRGWLRVGWVPLAIISGHALARRLDRGRDRARAALVADLALLADAGANGDRIAVGDGWWVGGSVFVQGKVGIVRCRAVRTFQT